MNLNILTLVFDYLPSVCDLCRVALPELEEERRPEGHEDGEDDGRVVVEEVHDLGVQARLLHGHTHS